MIQPQDSTHITYVGHATVRIEMDGVRLLTDPILRNRVTFLRRDRRAGFAPTLYQDVDAVLISHLHHDHLDLPSLRLLGSDMRMIVPRGAGEWLRSCGFHAVEEIALGDTVQVGSVTVTATYADHDPFRNRFGRRSDECLGYLVEGSHSIYFPGDTDLFPEMETLAPTLDVALVPVWGWGPTLGPGHMDPLRAAQALTMLRPRLAVPIHWGVLRPAGFGLLKPAFLSQPPRSFAEHAALLAPKVQVEIVPPGESLVVS